MTDFTRVLKQQNWIYDHSIPNRFDKFSQNMVNGKCGTYSIEFVKW